jgi:hypothetical protein
VCAEAEPVAADDRRHETLGRLRLPRRPGLRPELLAAVVRSNVAGRRSPLNGLGKQMTTALDAGMTAKAFGRGGRVVAIQLLASLVGACAGHVNSHAPASTRSPAAAAAPPNLADDPGWSVDMNWQSIVYREGSRGISIQIEPMFDVADIVYVPDAAAWSRTAPPWASSRRDEILARLKVPGWHRSLEWRESSDSALSTRLTPVPGGLESTPGGREFLQKRLFDPGSELTAEQAREIWQMLVRRFALAARGEVHLFVDGAPKGSVFEKVAVPALKQNPNVTLVWHSGSGK